MDFKHRIVVDYYADMACYLVENYKQHEFSGLFYTLLPRHARGIIVLDKIRQCLELRVKGWKDRIPPFDCVRVRVKALEATMSTARLSKNRYSSVEPFGNGK
jgi:hypothetical protein